MVMVTRAILGSLLVAGALLTQETAPQPFRTGVKVVVAPTLVTDRQGNYINGLQPSDFQLTDNGTPQQIKVDVTYVPISLVVAIQANSTAEPALPRVRPIGPLFQGLVTGDRGEVAIVAFDHRIQVMQEFTSDSSKIEAALQRIRAGSMTARLTDTVVEAARMLRTRPESQRRVLLLISETVDRGSSGKVRDALTDLQLDNITVYSVNINRFTNSFFVKQQPPRPDPYPAGARPLPPGVPPTPDNQAQVYGNPRNSGNFIPAFVDIFKQVKAIFVSNPVEVYTRFTGGDEHAFVNQRDLERAIGAIGDELHSEYIISYVPSNKNEGGFHDIAVTVNRPDAKVRTRPGYWVAAQF
jgi:VWFA-related protein